jgi:glycosyltransferase involved in cell wall biosynthesis
MNIGIDGNEANIKNRVGVNKYAYEMLIGLQKENEKKVSPNNLIVYLKDEPLKDLPRETKYFSYKIINGGGLWILTRLMPYLWKNPDKIDCLYSPSHYVPMFLSIPRICSIMDLDYLNNSEHFEKKVFWQLKYWTAISIFVSKRILTISDSSKRDIVRHYPFASNKITVTHLGYDRDKFNLNVSNDLVRRVKNRYSIVDDYILFVSTLKPSKNIEGLIDAFASLSSKYPKLSLVVAGKKGWMFEKIYERVEKLNLTKKIIFTDFFSEEERPALMAGCKFYCLPSFWEGFGLEILSAFGCGKPVVVSNVGSIPEVAGEAGIYVDPNDIESIAAGMENVLNMSEKEYNSIVELGFKQAKKFSWEECSKKTLKVIENIND